MGWDAGASEIIGELLLLVIIIPSVSAIYYVVLSSEAPQAETIVNIGADVQGRYIVLQHLGGEPIPGDAYITYVINGTKHRKKVEELLPPSAKENHQWDIGEKIYIPFSYDIDYIENFNKTKVTIIDPTRNAMLFSKILPMQPMSDLEVAASVSQSVVHVGDIITINITLMCPHGDVGVKNIDINCSLPPGLKYISNSADRGFYEHATGIWHIDRLDVGEVINLSIRAKVEPRGRRPFTQMALILDGSGSISHSEWKLVREGLANAIENESVFPHDGSVELTIIQFGSQYPPRAETRIGPVIVTQDNYVDISNRVRKMKQLRGVTPMGSAIRLAADEIFNSPRFNEDNRTVVCLITDGLPNCRWIHGTHDAEWGGNPWYRDVNEAHSGTASATAPYITPGWFVTRDLDASNASFICVDFWYKLNNWEWRWGRWGWWGWWLKDTDLEIYYYNGTSYNFITDLGANPNKRVWLHYHDVITDPQYFVPNFRIAFKSDLEWERVWIDDVSIEADKVLLMDGFENEYWNAHWTDPWREDTERARDYLISLLEMDEDQDEFDCLAVGPEPDIHWLNSSIVWPQPGYIAPPYNRGRGWVTHIHSFSEFEEAIKRTFKVMFQPIVATFRIQTICGSTDPHGSNNEIKIIITPEEER